MPTYQYRSIEDFTFRVRDHFSKPNSGEGSTTTTGVWLKSSHDRLGILPYLWRMGKSDTFDKFTSSSPNDAIACVALADDGVVATR